MRNFKKMLLMFVVAFSLMLLNTACSIGKMVVVEKVVDAAEVEIEEPVLEEEEDEVLVETGILLKTDDVKTEYCLNEEPDFTGLSVYVTYGNGDEKELSEGEYSISGVTMESYGNKEVCVTYKDFEESFEIEVTYLVTDIEPQTKYTTTSLNLRRGASTQFDAVKSVPVNTELTVVGEVDNGWAKVIHEDREYFCSGKYLSDSKMEVVKAVESGPYDNYVIGEPGASQEIVNSANAYWNRNVPNWLKKKYVESGWKVVISGIPLAQRFQGYGFGSSIAGMTDVYGGTIYIDNRKSCISRALLHEMGHFVDCTSGYVSSNPEFSGLFQAEAANFRDCTSVGDGHETSSLHEYFASVFVNVIINGENCKSQVPGTYEFVSRYMN